MPRHVDRLYEHGLLKSWCKDCGGSEICEHIRRKSRCKYSGGSEICEHGRLKYQCQTAEAARCVCTAGGRHSARTSSEICAHDRLKKQCTGCRGSENCTLA